MDHAADTAGRRAPARSRHFVARAAPGAFGRPHGPLIYLDTSVALAQLLAEDRLPPERLWQETLVSSRLLEYEIWNRIHARKLGRSHGDLVRAIVGRLALLELAAPILARALEPFPAPVRTLDALHLASMDFLRANGQTVELATYDDRLSTAARAMRIELYPLDANVLL